MGEREMSPEERERFEREQLHHEPKDSGGPASESDSHNQPEPITAPVIVGNPD